MKCEDSLTTPPCTCILLLYGIPGAGKTFVSHDLATRWSASSCSFIHVCCDDFYPPDQRVIGKDDDGCHFDVKGGRREILLNVEHCLKTNGHSEGGKGDRSDGRNSDCEKVNYERVHDDKWVHFIAAIRERSPHSIDNNGRFTSAINNVIIIDDNLVLRSMRYQYHQLARQYLIGFAEVCIYCDVATALQRNATRLVPIPSVTVATMGESLEIPSPDKHPWEGNNLICDSTYTRSNQWMDFVCSGIVRLCHAALCCPVKPLITTDDSMKEYDRQKTMESRVHQSDQILRRCVSKIMKDHGSSCNKEQLREMAGAVNRTRLSLLELIKQNKVDLLCWDDDCFKDNLESYFYKQIDYQFIA